MTNQSPIGKASITGSTIPGQTVYVDTSAVIDPDGFSSFVGYEWYLDGVYLGEGRSGTGNIHATGYPIYAADVGKILMVKYSYYDALGNLEVTWIRITKIQRYKIVHVSCEELGVWGNGNGSLFSTSVW